MAAVSRCRETVMSKLIMEYFPFHSTIKHMKKFPTTLLMARNRRRFGYSKIALATAITLPDKYRHISQMCVSGRSRRSLKPRVDCVLDREGKAPDELRARSQAHDRQTRLAGNASASRQVFRKTSPPKRTSVKPVSTLEQLRTIHVDRR